MFNSKKNTIGNQELYKIVCDHTDILKDIVKVTGSLNKRVYRSERIFLEIIKNLDFKNASDGLEFLKVIGNYFSLKTEDFIDGTSGAGDGTGNNMQMDELCGLWRASSQKKDPAILISKLPDGQYVFTVTYYKRDGLKYCSAYIIGNILEEPSTYVDLDGEERMIHYERMTGDNPEAILFNRMLYFRDPDL